MYQRIIVLLLIFSGACFASPITIERPTQAASAAGTLVEDIGIETLGGVFTPILPIGCKIPCSVTQVFSTADDKQTEIILFLFRGRAKMAKDAISLGSYVILGVPPQPRGKPQIAVTFAVVGDKFTLVAIDKDTNRSLEIKRREF